MAGLRHGVASLGVAMLAAAAGLGAGLWGAGDRGAPPGTPPTDDRPSSVERAIAADAVISAGFDRLVVDELSGRPVTVIALGDAARAAADGVARDLSTAGATVGGPVVLTDRWVDPASQDLRIGLAAQLSGDGGAGDLAADLAGVLAESPSGAGPARVWGLLTGGGLVSGDLPAARTTLVMVSPPPVPPAAAREWASLAQRIAGSGAGSGAGSDSGSARSGGGAVLVAARPVDGVTDNVTDERNPVTETSPVVALRDDFPAARVSTVDDIDTGLGRVALIRAVVTVATGEVGHYGSSHGADAATPAER